MKHHLSRKILSLAAATALCVALVPTAALAADDGASAVCESPATTNAEYLAAAATDQSRAADFQTVTLDGFTFMYGSARSMASMINDFRTGGQAWYWNSDNATQVACGSLPALTYDASLEKAAMQRAAEVAVRFSHTRPDDTDCFTALEDTGATYMGENIAANWSSNPESTYLLLREDEEPYSGQGHRRNMLDAKYNAVGIGFVEYQGRYYCAQEFGYISNPTADATPADNVKPVTMDIASRLIQSRSLDIVPPSITLYIDSSANLPSAELSLTTVPDDMGFYTHDFYSVVELDWVIGDSAIAQISGDKVLGKKEGTTRLTAPYNGKTVEVAVTVKNKPAAITMYRLYNSHSGEHLYTADANEKDTLSGIGWQYEGEGWKAPESSDTPVYRLYNPYSGDHHYTLDRNEYDELAAIGWNQEGVGWYSDDTEAMPLYRVFNPYATVGTHHYTTDFNEYQTLPSYGWEQEGVAWYGMK